MMNIMTNESIQLKMPKMQLQNNFSKQELALQTMPKQFDLAFSRKLSSPSYSPYEDKHTSSYFDKQSVQKNLKNLARVVDSQPKSQKNNKFIRSISQRIKLLATQQQVNNSNDCQKTESQQKVSKSPSKRSVPTAYNLKIIKSKKSPYKVFPIFIKIQSETKARNKAIQSACMLPQIASSQPNIQEGPTFSPVLPKQNKTNKKKIDVLHNLKHKQFVDFLNKKKEILSKSFKLINREIVTS